MYYIYAIAVSFFRFWHSFPVFISQNKMLNVTVVFKIVTDI